MFYYVILTPSEHGLFWPLGRSSFFFLFSLSHFRSYNLFLMLMYLWEGLFCVRLIILFNGTITIQWYNYLKRTHFYKFFRRERTEKTAITLYILVCYVSFLCYLSSMQSAVLLYCSVILQFCLTTYMLCIASRGVKQLRSSTDWGCCSESLAINYSRLPFLMVQAQFLKPAPSTGPSRLTVMSFCRKGLHDLGFN